MTCHDVEINRQPAPLYQVLKLSGLVGSGGEAKAMISQGLVTVNGETETRKRRKTVDGDEIVLHSERIRVSLVATGS